MVSNKISRTAKKRQAKGGSSSVRGEDGGRKPWVAIFGSSSAIAKGVAEVLAQMGYSLHLLERDLVEANRSAADLRLRHGIQAKGWAFEATAFQKHEKLWKSLSPRPRGVLVAFGAMGEVEKTLTDSGHLLQVIHSNYTGALTVLSPAAFEFEKWRRGGDQGPLWIAAISSVAGERGRATNLVYGSAKAGLTAYLSALRQRLTPLGISVTTIIPGYVATPMTEGMATPKALTATVQGASRQIARAIISGASQVYVKPIWRWVMFAIRHIPEGLFRKLKF